MAGARPITIVAILFVAAITLFALRDGDPGAPLPSPVPSAPPSPVASAVANASALPASAAPTAVAPTTPPPAAANDSAPDRTSASTLGRITGVVHDPEHQPIAGAEVRILVVVGNGTEWRPATLTDASGAYELTDVPQVPVTVHAAAPGFVAGRLEAVRIPSASDLHLTLPPLVLGRELVYRGRVVANNQGLPGVHLRLATAPDAPPGTPISERTTRTDDDGNFVFTQPPALPCVLTVEANRVRRLEMRKITSAADLAVIELVPLGRITGKVVDAVTGAPLPNARVRVRQTEPPIFITSDHGIDETIAVGPDGSFDLQQPDALRFGVEGTEPDHLSGTIGPFDAGESTGPHFLRLSRGIPVQGRLTWHGQPIGGMAQLHGDGPNPGMPIAAVIAADGAIRLSAVPPGNYVLRVDPNSGPQVERALTLAPPGPFVLDLEVGDGASVFGTVHGGAPGDRIVCVHGNGHQRRATVEADGTYQLAWLAPGTWTIAVLPKQDPSGRLTQLWQLLDVPAVTLRDGQEVHLDLDAAPRLAASLTCPLGRRALDSHVELVPRTPQQKRVPQDCLRCAIGADGTFDLDAVLPGEWLVRWTPREGAVREVVVTLPAGRTTTVAFPQ